VECELGYECECECIEPSIGSVGFVKLGYRGFGVLGRRRARLFSPDPAFERRGRVIPW
jgi:hypothetical protein